MGLVDPQTQLQETRGFVKLKKVLHSFATLQGMQL